MDVDILYIAESKYSVSQLGQMVRAKDSRNGVKHTANKHQGERTLFGVKK